MIKNYIKIAIRNLWAFKGYSVVNLLGLSTGLVCCLFIFLFVEDEQGYDTFHKDHERIFRITTRESDEGIFHHYAHAFAPLAPLFNTAFPGANQTVRFLPYGASVKNQTNNVLFHEPKFAFADSLFFSVFGFDFILGDATTALKQPNSVVLTEPAARRYFGDESAIGKTLMVENNIDFVVTGVIKSPSNNSTIQFELLANIKKANTALGYEFENKWYYPPVYSFVKFPDVVNANKVKSSMSDFNQKHLPGRIKGKYQFELQPIKEMHFRSLEADLQPITKPIFLYTLLAIALLILSIACFNYINLSIAHIMQRFREIGMRKVLGATNRHIFIQMVFESGLSICIALIISIGLANFFTPSFNSITEKNLSLYSSSSLLFWTGFVALLIVVGIIISTIPWLTAIKFKVLSIIKGNALLKNRVSFVGLSFKNTFIIIQFGIATLLLVAAIVIRRQINYVKSKDLGIDSQQVMVVPLRDYSVQNNFLAAKNILKNISGVSGVSAISNFPWEKGYYDFPSSIRGGGKEQKANIPTLLVEREFIEVMGMKMQQGRPFSQSSFNDSNAVFLINQTAARQFGIDRLDGFRLNMQGVAEDRNHEGEIVGIVEDFYLKSLHHKIEPVVMAIAPMSYYLENFVLRVNTTNIQNTIAALSENWKKISPDRPFEYFFLDDVFNNLYKKEARMSNLFNLFTGLALFISCMGMFALVALLCSHRIKEIGIRKVLGADVSNIIGLISKDFMILVIISIIVFSPIAYYIMSNWLQEFAYRTEIKWSVFGIASIITLFMALLTIGYQAIKAAVANPVKSLRTE